MEPAPAAGPRAVDAELRRRPLTLPHVRSVIPRACFDLQPFRAWWTLARILLCLAVCWWLLSSIPDAGGLSLLWEVPALLAVWLVHGWVLVGLFLVGHDAGHGSFSPRRSVNSVVGWLAMTPLANSFHAWRITHERHHAHTQLRGHDVDWAGYLLTKAEFESSVSRPPLITRLGYALPCGIFLWIAWNTVRRASMTHVMFDEAGLARERRALLWSNLTMVLALLALYGSLCYVSGVWGMLKYHGIPATVAMVTSWVIITIQHASEDSLWYDAEGWTPVQGQMVSTYDIRFPRWIEYLWCDGNIHIPHHVAPSIPWYHLRTAAAALRKAFPACYQERDFTWTYVRWLWRTPFIERAQGQSYYVLAGGAAPASAAMATSRPDASQIAG